MLKDSIDPFQKSKDIPRDDSLEIPTMTCEITANLQEIEPLLSKIREALHCHSSREWKRVELALTEGLSNAILHGSPRGNEDKVFVEWNQTLELLEVQITDSGDFHPPPRGPRLPEDPLSEEGRGLYLMEELMSSVRHDLVQGHHRLTLQKKWKSA